HPARRDQAPAARQGGVAVPHRHHMRENGEMRMRYRAGKLIGAGAAALVVAATAVTMGEAPAQVPRTKDGKPNFTGIWQVMNTANWDVQSHAARMGPVVALGAAFSIPAGVGVVDGDEIPYQPAALKKKQEN